MCLQLRGRVPDPSMGVETHGLNLRKGSSEGTLPEERAFRDIYHAAGIPLPAHPSCLYQYLIYVLS